MICKFQIVFIIMIALAHSSELSVFDNYKGSNLIAKSLNINGLSDSAEVLFYKADGKRHAVVVFDTLYRLQLREIFKSRIDDRDDSMIIPKSFSPNEKQLIKRIQGRFAEVITAFGKNAIELDGCSGHGYATVYDIDGINVEETNCDDDCPANPIRSIKNSQDTIELKIDGRIPNAVEMYGPYSFYLKKYELSLVRLNEPFWLIRYNREKWKLMVNVMSNSKMPVLKSICTERRDDKGDPMRMIWK